MQAASNEYKDMMRRKWRNPLSHLCVTIGLINQQAQASAYIPEPDVYTYYSDLVKPMDNYKVQELYATCDQDYTTVDGSMYFLPRDAADVVLNQGIVTDGLQGEIEIRFPVQYDIKGLTVEFGKAYPVDFSIISDGNTVEITGNASGHYVTEEIFPAATFLRFVPSVMANGQSRLRINQITMGIGIYFDSKKILSATKKEHISPISEELPTIDFSVTVDNKDRAYDVENEESTVNFLEIGQSIEALYGQAMDDGTIEWIPGTSLALKSWSADDTEMDFQASDRFDGMDGTYYRGRYHPDGMSLYDMAVDVLADAQVDYRDYWIDPYLKDVLVVNPMPVVAHKEALQLIANAGRCILYQDRTGRIILKSSFVPDMEAASDNETYFSHASAILDHAEKEAYALPGQDYTGTSGAQYFLPRQTTNGATYLNTGYVSEAVAEEDGLFTDNPTVEITTEAAYKCFGLTLEFGRNWPDTVIFHAYYNNAAMEDYTVPGLTQTYVVSHEFPEFDRLVLEFSKGCPNNRVALDNIIFGDSTDYVLEYGVELTKTPKGTQLAKVRELQVVRTIYNLSTEDAKELARETISVTALDNRYTFYFSNPSYDLKTYVPVYVEATNMVQNGSFDTGVTGWLNAQYDAARKCTYVVSEDGNAVHIVQTVQMISGHKYYLRGNFMREESPGEYSGNDECDLVRAIANRESFNINLRPEAIAPDGVWHTKSAIDTVETTGEWDLRIYTYGNKRLYIDSLLLVDLTAAWGIGNEPDIEWCDKFIGYFTGIASIPKYGCEIVDSSAYYATVELTGITGPTEVVVTGRDYVTTQSKVSRQLNPTGSLEAWNNPLVSDTVHAANLADWIGDYMKSDREYDLSYRGEPRIDANDIAFLENKYVPDLLIRVTDHTLKFNGGLSGTIKARRDMSYVATAKNRLAGQ